MQLDGVLSKYKQRLRLPTELWRDKAILGAMQILKMEKLGQFGGACKTKTPAICGVCKGYKMSSTGFGVITHQA